MPVEVLVCRVKQCRCLWGSGLTSAPIVISYPVAEDAGTSVGGLDVSDVGEVNLFGKNQQQQTLHPHWCDLDTDRDSERFYELIVFLFKNISFLFLFLYIFD